ncbi:unnamed protein product [Moneuplotes crassus]|uniref:Uncharacterized protein n=1 Tax=Euplotes crassus TaxID=5936 RepID=A0AAD2D9V9_EUPCR|nr:unnamed protein product [Moneuplotes crassus]
MNACQDSNQPCIFNISAIATRISKKSIPHKAEHKLNKSRNLLKKHNTTTGCKGSSKKKDAGIYKAFISTKNLKSSKPIHAKSVCKKEKLSKKQIYGSKVSPKCSLQPKICKNVLYNKTFRAKINPKSRMSRNTSKPKYLATQPIHSSSTKLPVGKGQSNKKRGTSKPKTSSDQRAKWCNSFTYTKKEANKFGLPRSPQNKCMNSPSARPKRPFICSKSPNISQRSTTAKMGYVSSCRKRNEDCRSKFSPKVAKNSVPQSYRNVIIPAPRINKKLIHKKDKAKRGVKRSPPAVPKRSIKLNVPASGSRKISPKPSNSKIEKYSKYISKKNTQKNKNKSVKNKEICDGSTPSTVNISVEMLECLPPDKESELLDSDKNVAGILSGSIQENRTKESPTLIYDMPEDLESEISSFKGSISPEKLFVNSSDFYDNPVERRIEILEIQDALLDELCDSNQAPIDQKVYQIELLNNSNDSQPSSSNSKTTRNHHKSPRELSFGPSNPQKRSSPSQTNYKNWNSQLGQDHSDCRRKRLCEKFDCSGDEQVRKEGNCGSQAGEFLVREGRVG